MSKGYFAPNINDHIMTIKIGENSIININQRYMTEYMTKGEYRHFWAVVGRGMKKANKRGKLKK